VRRSFLGGADVRQIAVEGRPTVEIYKEFRFEAAHLLPNVPPGHQCARLHGHSYRVVVRLEGELDPRAGWVRDFADLSSAMSPLIQCLDHHDLNEIDGLENPTSEILARWLWERLLPALPELSEVEVCETVNSGCVYRGEPLA
jgi:6-pyruvoyltetrahydropterin/6-carboxytetrahydropterin synthase